jgi:hypothetical protein
MSCRGPHAVPGSFTATTQRRVHPYGVPGRGTYKIWIVFFGPRRKGVTKPSELYSRSHSENPCQAPIRSMLRPHQERYNERALFWCLLNKGLPISLQASAKRRFGLLGAEAVESVRQTGPALVCTQGDDHAGRRSDWLNPIFMGWKRGRGLCCSLLSIASCDASKIRALTARPHRIQYAGLP